LKAVTGIRQIWRPRGATLRANDLEDLEKLRDVGLTDGKIFYMIGLAVLYNFTNRIMSA
jgi:hypothetical protein